MMLVKRIALILSRATLFLTDRNEGAVSLLGDFTLYHHTEEWGTFFIPKDQLDIYDIIH